MSGWVLWRDEVGAELIVPLVGGALWTLSTDLEVGDLWTWLVGSSAAVRLFRLTTAPLGLPCLSHSEIKPCSSSLARRSASSLRATAGNTRLSILPVPLNSPVASSLNISGALDAAQGGNGPASSPAARKSSGLPADMDRCLGFARRASGAPPARAWRALGEGESVVLLRPIAALAGLGRLAAGLANCVLVELFSCEGGTRFWADEGFPVWPQF